MPEDLKYIIESLLFVSDTPLTMDHLKGLLDDADTVVIKTAIADLMAEYERRDGGFVLKQVAGGFQFRTRGRYNEWIKRLIKPNTPRLSKASLETLAIVAYKQPIIRSDIEHIRGVDSGGVLRMLMERKLIRVLGRKEIPGRPLIYATTKHFLEVFELKDLKDLPTPREIEELSQTRLEDEPEVKYSFGVQLVAPATLPADLAADSDPAKRGNGPQDSPIPQENAPPAQDDST